MRVAMELADEEERLRVRRNPKTETPARNRYPHPYDDIPVFLFS